MNTSIHLGTAVITRATSCIGAAYAGRLARRGYDLILAAGDPGRLNALAMQITDSTGRSVETLVADLVDPTQVPRVERVLRTDASITLLVCHVEDVTGCFITDPNHPLGASVRLARTAAPAFVARGTGTIINFVSCGPVFEGGEMWVGLASTLARVRSLRREFRVLGCRVQLVLTVAGVADAEIHPGLTAPHRPAPVPMSAEAEVDAALRGLDRGEWLTILSPSDRNVSGDRTH